MTYQSLVKVTNIKGCSGKTLKEKRAEKKDKKNK
jgi:hypothetical protein